jgi:hypothetical protein
MNRRPTNEIFFHILKISAILALMLCCLFQGAWADRLPTVLSAEARLANEVQRMIQAGHLGPGICYTEQHYSVDSRRHGYQLADYWHNPGELIYTLSIAIPYLPDSLKSAAKDYLKSEFAHYPAHTYVHMGPGGASREIAARPSEYADNWAFYYNQSLSSATEEVDWGAGNITPPWRFPPFNIYACWKYAQVFPETAPAMLSALQGKVLEMPAFDGYHITHPSVLNAYIAGYYGYLNLQSLAGQTRSPDVERWLGSALEQRMTALNQDPSLLPGSEAGGFIWLTPELGDYLFKNASARVEQVLVYQNWAAPYWHIARAEETTRVDSDRAFWEGYHSHIYETASQFQARAYALKWNHDRLEKYLDAPSVYRGDLTYIQNLVAILQSQSAAPVPPVLRLSQ